MAIHLSDEDIAKIAAAVAKALPEHACKFSDHERHLFHQLGEELDKPTIIALGVVGRGAYKAGVVVGRVVARGVTVGLIVAFIAGISALGWLVVKGWIKP